MLLRPLRCDHDKKVYFFISALINSPHRDDENKILFLLWLIATTPTKSHIFPIATTFTTPWSWQKYMFSFQHYVYYILIMTTNIFFFISVLRSLGLNYEKKSFPIATTFTTFVNMTKVFFFFAAAFTTSWLALRSLHPGSEKIYFSFHFSTTFTTSCSQMKINLFSFQQYVPYAISSVIL